MDGKDDISINMPCAPMPVSTGEAAEFMHPTLVTYLKGYQAYYTRGGLIPRLTKKGFFWKSQAPAIHNAVLQYKLFIDGENAASCTTSLSSAFLLHTSLGPDCTLKNVLLDSTRWSYFQGSRTGCTTSYIGHVSARIGSAFRAVVHEKCLKLRMSGTHP